MFLFFISLLLVPRFFAWLQGGWLGERYRAVVLQWLQDRGTKGPGASSGAK